MLDLTKYRTVIIMTSLIILSSSIAYGKGADLSFRGTVKKIETTTSATGTVTLHLVGFDIPVKVVAETDIESHGDDVGLAGLSVGDFVKVSGFFSTSGIVAQEIQILDEEKGEFRLRGDISKVTTATVGTTITVLGVDVLVNANTKIERRGPAGGFTASDLVVGMQVDVSGNEEENKLVAKRVKVGNRDSDVVRVRFEGKIDSIKDANFFVDTDGGGMVEVITNSSTKIIGTLAVGKTVDVRGTLNSDLKVVAETVKVDGEGEDDRDNKGNKTHKEIRLSPATAADAARGSAEIEYELEDGKLEQEFEVEIEKAQPNKDYKIRVEISTAAVDFGALTTDSRGRGKVKFGSHPKGQERDINKLLPSGKDVRNFTKVQITLDGKVVMEGSF
jgi:hypothetical protein